MEINIRLSKAELIPELPPLVNGFTRWLAHTYPSLTAEQRSLLYVVKGLSFSAYQSELSRMLGLA